MSEVEDFFRGNRTAAQTGLVASLDDDPEQAARSVELGDATGVPSTAIYGDVDGFERQHKAQLGSAIIASNTHIADYLNSHPMAPRVSHDDLGQLDLASRAIGNLGDQSAFGKWLKSDSISRSFMEGFGDQPIGASAVLKRPEDFEFALRHPLAAGLAATVATPLDALSRATSGLIHLGHDGIASVFGDKFANEAAAMAEWAMMRGDMHAAVPTPNTVLKGSMESAMAGKPLQFVQQVADVSKAVDPYIRAGVEPPVGVHPLIDQAKTLQAKTDGDTIADALKESVKSATRDRAPDFYANFVRSHVGDREIGISSDAIRELYGDKVPTVDDGKLGFIPDLADKLATAESTGGDVKVPLADWLAKVDPEVAKELHDHLRVRPEGLTIEEGKVLDEQNKQKVQPTEQAPAKESPIDDIETIGQAAVKVGGEVYTGTNHLEALENAAKKLGVDVTALFDRKDGDPGFITADDGFVTSKGRYVQRSEAMDIAKKADQLKAEVKNTKAKELSAEDVKPISSPVITEPLPLVRGSAALEPLFSVGDRKVKLERMSGGKGPRRTGQSLAEEQGQVYEQDKGYWDNQAESIRSQETKFGPDQGFHDFNLQDETGKTIGQVNLSEAKGGKQLYIEMIQAGADKRMYDPNFLGPTLIRDLFRQIKAEFPNAESITGHRVSGAREKAGSYELKSAMPVIKFEDLNNPARWQSLHEGWKDIQKGVYGEPIEMTPEKQRVVDSVNEVLDRIVPKGVGVEGFEKIGTEAGNRAGGVYTRYEDAQPWISWSLESADPTGTARHEAIHHLRNAGFFKEGEWDTLSRAARDGGWVEKYGIDKRFDADKLDNASKLEESIADAYKNWAREPEATTPLGKIFSRIKELLDAIRTKLKEAFGADLSAEELFAKVESGEIGSRESGAKGEAGAKFEEGKEVLYHGTSKDTPFSKLKEARNGTWFTTDPKEASSYAENNDSRGPVFDQGKIVDKNIASRIIPMTHDFQNTLQLKKWPEKLIKAENYKRAQSEYFDQLRKEGYDSVRVPTENGHSLVVSLDNSKLTPAYAPNKVKGAKFETLDEEKHPDIGGPQAERLRDRIGKLSGELSVAKSQGFDISADPRATELSEARAELRSITSGTFGMTVDQYQRYMKLVEKRHAEDLAAAFKSAEAQQRRTQTKEWKAARTEMRDQVREEIESRPDIALDQMLSQEKLKFHPDALTPEQRASLPKEFIQKKDGIAPDDAAGYFGYHSGDAMVDRLSLLTADRKAAGMSTREWANHLIDTETDRRMEETHGNLNQRILEEAKDQAISETQLNLLHEEVLHLGLMAKSEFPISKAQLRAWNKEIFDKTPIGDISTDDYLRAAGKAGRAAELSLLKEDFADAFREKQRQNNAMIMASYAKAYEKARAQFDRTAKTFRKREVPSVPQEWTSWIHDLLQRTGNRINRSIQDLNESIKGQTLQEFIDEKEADTMGNRPLPIADFLRDEDLRTSMDKLTAQQFTDLKSAVDMLAKQGRDEKKIYAAGEAADRAQVVSDMRDRLKTFPQQLLPDERNWLQEKVHNSENYIAGILAVPTMLRRWERADPRGIFSRYITYPLRQADNLQSVLQRETAAALREVGPLVDAEKKVDSPFPDPKTRTEENPQGLPWNNFARKHVLGMLAHAGNKSNWRVLAKGYSADPEALMQWLVQHTTKEDWAQAQARGDKVFKTLIAKSDTVRENISGATVEKIPLEPINNKHGDFAGWYHPLDADPLRKEVWVKNQDTGTWTRNSISRHDNVMDKYGKSYATTADGYTRKRTGAVYPLDLDITAMNGTINQMIHDISYRQPLLEVQKIFKNEAFRNEIDNHYGSIYRGLLDPWLQDLAGGASKPDPTWKWAGEWSEHLRQNVISTYIGLNIYTALKHGPTAAVMSSREIGLKHFAKPFAKDLAESLIGDPLRKSLDIVGADWLSGAVKGMYSKSTELGLTMSEFAMKYGESLQRRERHWQDTVAGETKNIVDAPTTRERIIQASSVIVAKSDMLSAKSTWIGEYNKRTAQGLSHGEAVDLADDAVTRAHGTTGASDRPALVRGGGPAHGWLTSVYGFMGTRMQRMIELGYQLNDIHQLGREGELGKAAARVPKLLGDTMAFAIWPILVEQAVEALYTDDQRTSLQRLGSALTLGMSSSLLYIRDLAHGIVSDHEPGVGLLSSAAHDVVKPIKDIEKGSKAFNKEHAGKTVQDILTMFGEVTGMAPKVVGNAARFGIDVYNRQQRPSAGDIFRGVTRGNMKKREEH